MFEEEWKQERIERYLRAAALIPYGVSYLDDALFGILPNELVLVGARTGRGKTELATTISANAAAQGKRVFFFALEADKWEIQQRMKYRKLAQFWREHYGDSAIKFPRFREWLQQGFDADWDRIEKIADQQLVKTLESLRVVYKGSRYSPQDFIRELEGIQEEADLIIVDHLHYFDLAGTSETDGLKQAIHTIRNAAIHHGKPVILLAHLRKGDRSSSKALPELDDFHGHSDIVKVSTTVLLMAPADGFHDLGVYPTYFHIAKCRTASEVTPFAAVLGFDFGTNNYSPQYKLLKASFHSDPEPIESSSDFPSWAKRAIRPREIVGGKGYGGRGPDA